MKKIRTNSILNNQKGFVSFFVTIMVMIIFGILILSFSQISNREGVSALNRDLSTNALYAAESGINDAYTSIRSALSGSSGPSTPTTLSYTGSPQTYTVPAGVTSLNLTLFGAAGGAGAGSYQGGGAGGLGSEVTGVLSVTPGQILTVDVGGQGGNGTSCGAAGSSGWGAAGSSAWGPSSGGTGGSDPYDCAPGGGGGGASVIYTPYSGILYLVTIAAGGGGGGGGDSVAGGTGGTGGQTDGSAGMSVNDSTGGGGATQSSGGTGGTSYSCSNGAAGGAGAGGAGAGATNISCAGPGAGGGGGGYYGGGGGGLGSGGSSGGGGGVSIEPAGGSATSGVQSGNGQVIIAPVTSSGSPSTVPLQQTSSCSPNTYGNPVLDSSSQYTCVLVSSSPSSLSYLCPSFCPNNSLISLIQSSGNPINNLTIKWSDPNISSSSGCSTLNPLPFFSNSNWPANCQEVLRVDLVPFNSGTTTLSGLQTGVKTFFLYPQPSASGTQSFAQINPNNDGTVYPANCSTAPNCSFTIQGLAAYGTTFYARVQYYYGTSPTISMTGTDINNLPISFTGSQLQIDATGLSGTVLKRVSANIAENGSDTSPYSLPLPPNDALQSTDSICKSFLIYQSNLYEIIPSSKPGDLTSAVTPATQINTNNNSDFCDPI